jgi:hypothetical protein
MEKPNMNKESCIPYTYSNRLAETHSIQSYLNRLAEFWTNQRRPCFR